VQTDDAWAYVRNRSLAELLKRHGIAHRRIPPRTPTRNRKIQRYQQTFAREWAYGPRYRTSDERAAALPIWLTRYNYSRNHSSLSKPATHRPRSERS
jgi:transposase InsO family protein